jgi:hypothetical protein
MLARKLAIATMMLGSSVAYAQYGMSPMMNPMANPLALANPLAMANPLALANPLAMAILWRSPIRSGWA